MKWLVLDSLYTPEQFFCSHLDAYSWYLAQAGEEVSYRCLNGDGPAGSIIYGERMGD